MFSKVEISLHSLHVKPVNMPRLRVVSDGDDKC